MKKALPVILFLLAVAGLTYSFLQPSKEGNVTALNPVGTANQNQASIRPDQNTGGNSVNSQVDGMDTSDTTSGEEEFGEDIKPAAVAYQSADAALEAIKKGAANYDDILLEQFTTPGADCTWCPQLYASLKDLLKSPDFKPEDKSYFAEILAISGNVENIQALVEGLKNSTDEKDKEVYTAAIELAIGKDDVVDYLDTQLSTENEEVRESVVAALTNQGTPKAFETVFKHVVGHGDPDGYYSQGIGPGEMILDESALPKAQEYLQKRDQYSHLAVKAMLNSGISGLRSVLDVLANSSNIEQDKTLFKLKESVDHVSYDEESEKLLKEKANSGAPLVREFANDILGSFSQQLEEITDEEQPVQSLPPTPAS